MELDLLRNRDSGASLGPFDGKVAAMAHNAGEHYFITTNADYVPALPSLELPHAVFLRTDMRYGSDDPTLWPQQFTQRYCHLAAIARQGTRPELEVLWWNPTRNDFLVGSAVTRGLGRLRNRCVSQFLPVVNDLVDRCKQYQCTSPTPISPLFGQLIQQILIWVEQLQSLPTTFPIIVFAVASLQRACLELDALYQYITVYKPRIENYLSAPPPNTPVSPCVGAFTTVPAVAQQLWAACLPFWFLRPYYVFDAENILAVVPLQQPTHLVHGLADEAPQIVYSGNSTEEKIAAIHLAGANNRWYRDPFETGQTHSLSKSPSLDATPASAPTPQLPTIHPTGSRAQRPVAGSSSQGIRSRPSFQPCMSQFNLPVFQTPAKGPAKIPRDKFSTLAIPEMPPSIVAWAEALAQVDTEITPFTSNPADRRYVLPEPALLINSTPEQRWTFLHHWTLLKDGFLFMLGQGYSEPLSAQEWRDVLKGLLQKRGHPNSRTHRRSAGLEERIRPALEASNVTSIEGFPAAPETVPQFSLEKTHEIVWQVAESNFRFEFCALDKRASKMDRADEVRTCFAGQMLVGVPLEMGKRGLAAMALEQRHVYIVRVATLMLDWTTSSPRPSIVGPGVARHLHWSQSQMQDLERAVCRYYTQAFWEYFGRAAVVPMRLEHDLEKENGQM
ncbi:hypothetical protein GGX14DRAFT_363312 [Mycena pura]|uniref:Uncharacterized protein n=1 Tax=Mycena pura TaxID=153505 RepID=A0AAD6VE34_9AGAR|nr:hypothetical protein GGX14DRAFT_363312 [Mycena pura]